MVGQQFTSIDQSLVAHSLWKKTTSGFQLVQTFEAKVTLVSNTLYLMVLQIGNNLSNLFFHSASDSYTDIFGQKTETNVTVSLSKGQDKTRPAAEWKIQICVYWKKLGICVYIAQVMNSAGFLAGFEYQIFT